MAQINFVLPDRSKLTVDVPEGQSVMEAALAAGVPKSIGECGGAAMCGTCHVYVDEAYIDRLIAADAVEDQILDGVMADRLPTSRLSCQIPVTEEVDGLVIYVPEL